MQVERVRLPGQPAVAGQEPSKASHSGLLNAGPGRLRGSFSRTRPGSIRDDRGPQAVVAVGGLGSSILGSRGTGR
jgi:hypothetical protein